MRQFVVFCGGMTSFFRELKRRRVYRTAIAYVIFASAMIQVGGTILATFNARIWVQQLFMVAIVTGFPFALVLGWIYDITGRGIRRTPNVRGLRVHSRRQQLWMVGLVGVAAAALTLAGYWAWHPWRNADDLGTVPEKSIAVLPFENLSDNKQNAYFADGVQDQILTNLSKVADLKVISHTSVRQYKSGTQRNLREIGRQLGVAFILEGTVQSGPDRLRITANLIDARKDSHLWAESYDRSVADLFAVQSELAQSIAAQLQAKLSPKQKADIEERPTRDLIAFELICRRRKSSIAISSFPMSALDF